MVGVRSLSNAVLALSCSNQICNRFNPVLATTQSRARDHNRTDRTAVGWVRRLATVARAVKSGHREHTLAGHKSGTVGPNANVHIPNVDVPFPASGATLLHLLQ